ncbi:hypothetical protein AMTRI_Chr12g240010 [Amborella trichopoda]|uniref:Zinc finger CCCH domain-containing protein 18 n=1 Tax=Amborella trichopoda TaxID=13333 RepID=W1PAZ8_AMBTC|nr:zinc finger CCCH domain-containing protein 18 [Amborella trichopoda]ERN07087.1 hypothetical protein AMTR_s00019p00079600 [Amborella trichopoda]|eukprot:XP_006845412.1 zinc finger CCCH domain-containing protein 18 [Amborella trichopoda]
MAEDDDGELEKQLELQLMEQKESLGAINDALVSDPQNPELIMVHEELIAAIKAAEEGLFHLKRSRLLLEANHLISGAGSDSNYQEVEPEPLEPSKVEAEPLEEKGFSVGARCRFRHTNGRWYDGHVIGIEGVHSAKISFSTPTSENMVICKFFLQQRCRFGNNCRLSHGVDMPLSSLKPYIPPIWRQSLVGSSVFALTDSQAGIWREAELESWDDGLKMGQVVFRDDGTHAKLGSDFLSLYEYAQLSNEEQETSSRGSETSDDEEDELGASPGGLGLSPNGVGFLQASSLRHGVQTETAVFAKWEVHTRGVASKMMANMGYREGMGLGSSGQGIVDPIPVKVLPPKQSLDYINGVEERETKREKKRSRGGRRKREKRYAEAQRAAKAEEEVANDVFGFINNQLAMQKENEREKLGRSEVKEREIKREDRRALVAYDEEVRELRNRVEKLEEMVERNRREKAVFEAASRKLNETRRALADAEAARAAVSNEVTRKEKEKRWLKF